MNDWDRCYAAAAQHWLAGLNPYTSTLCYASPPWALPILAPFSWIPWWGAMLLPLVALIFLAARYRKPWLMLIVGTSFPFIAGSMYANANWLIMLGAGIGGPLGAILCTVKPQEGLLMIPALLSRRDTNVSRVKLLLPLAVAVLMFLPLLLTWLHWMFAIGHGNDGIRNFSLFPYTIPIGLFALWRAWSRKSIIWGAVASLMVAPYFYIHSAMTLQFLVAERNWKWGLALSAAVWMLIGLIVIGAIPIDL